jgi:hypothetical protein
MAEPKTKPTGVSVESHIAAIANEGQRNDARRLVALMRRATKQEPRMWGPSIVGFGSYHYKYPSGHEGDSALAAFAARGKELVGSPVGSRDQESLSKAQEEERRPACAKKPQPIDKNRQLMRISGI